MEKNEISAFLGQLSNVTTSLAVTTEKLQNLVKDFETERGKREKLDDRMDALERHQENVLAKFIVLNRVAALCGTLIVFWLYWRMGK